MANPGNPTLPEKGARPEPPHEAKLEWGSDAVAWVLRALPLDYIALNPGASYRGLHDSLVNLLGDQAPSMLVCLHEEHAVAIAHGYAKVTGRPMAAAVHSNVGLMHASMAVYNAWCDRAPVLLLGATGPVDASKRRPWIDWLHTSQDQAALVRSYVKWDDQPASPEAAVEAVLRGFQLASRLPQGPVYICLDVGMQESRLESQPQLPDPTRFLPGRPPAPAPDALDTAVNWLRQARRPVILAGRVSRNEDEWKQRVALAESLGANVLTDMKIAAAFPTRHALHPVPPAFRLTQEGVRILQEADVILSLDWLDLGGTLYTVWPDGKSPARVIHASLDEYAMNGWSMNHQRMAPVDLPLDGDPAAAVQGLLSRLVIAAPAAVTGTAAEARQVPPLPAADDQPMNLSDMAAFVCHATANDQVSWLRFPLGWPGDTCDFRHPLDYLGYDGGAGIGSGPGMVLGSALALRDSGRLPVAILGDGDVMMGVNALWSAARHRIPLLILVANNRAYYNDVVHQEAVAQMRNRPVENKWVGQQLEDPMVDIAAMARAQGWFAEGPVTTGSTLSEALSRAIAEVKAGRPALVDVHVQPGYSSSVVPFKN